jgi:hypothetical protein
VVSWAQGVQFDQRLNGGTFYKVEAPRVTAGVSRREGEWIKCYQSVRGCSRAEISILLICGGAQGLFDRILRRDENRVRFWKI